MTNIQILILAPDPNGCVRLRSLIRDEGFEVAATRSVQAALDRIRSDTPKLVLLAEDLGPEIDGCEAATRLANATEGRHCPILMFSELPATAKRIDRALRAGCDRYLGRTEMGALGSILKRTLASRATVEVLDHQRHALDQENRRLKAASPPEGLDLGTPGPPVSASTSGSPWPAIPATGSIRRTYRPEAWLGVSQTACDTRRNLLRLAGSEASPVLVLAPRGAGTRLLVRILHDTKSPTNGLMQLDCTGLSATELRAALFGAATLGEPGLCEQARNGTVHLESIEGLSIRAQRGFLEVLNQQVVPGSTYPVNVRWVVSTSADLAELVERGAFDRELHGALNRDPLVSVPLAERAEDLSVLVRDFIGRYGANKGIRTISIEAMMALEAYGWPGNVEELADCIEQACVRATGTEIELAHLTRPVRRLEARCEQVPNPAAPLPTARSARDTKATILDRERGVAGSGSWRERPWEITEHDPIDLEHYEKKALLRALASCGGDKLATAKLLKVGKSTLYRKLKRLGISAGSGPSRH